MAAFDGLFVGHFLDASVFAVGPGFCRYSDQVANHLRAGQRDVMSWPAIHVPTAQPKAMKKPHRNQTRTT
jgi:hypothetical protein